jgi:hypothetical protein
MSDSVYRDEELGKLEKTVQVHACSALGALVFALQLRGKLTGGYVALGPVCEQHLSLSFGRSLTLCDFVCDIPAVMPTNVPVSGLFFART